MQKTFGLLVCCLLMGRVAQAQETGQDPRVGEAKTACVAGDVPKGVRLLAELYTASGDPIWIFNQGRCYQQNDQRFNIVCWCPLRSHWLHANSPPMLKTVGSTAPGRRNALPDIFASATRHHRPASAARTKAVRAACLRGKMAAPLMG